MHHEGKTVQRTVGPSETEALSMMGPCAFQVQRQQGDQSCFSGKKYRVRVGAIETYKQLCYTAAGG